MPPRGDVILGEERFARSVGVLAPEAGVLGDDDCAGPDWARDNLNLETFEGFDARGSATGSAGGLSEVEGIDSGIVGAEAATGVGGVTTAEKD